MSSGIEMYRSEKYKNFGGNIVDKLKTFGGSPPALRGGRAKVFTLLDPGWGKAGRKHNREVLVRL